MFFHFKNLFWAGIFLVLVSSAARADAVTETQVLSFGTFAMKDNAAQYDIVVAPSGTITRDPSYVPLTNGQKGIYSLTGFPANTPVIVSMTDTDIDPASNAGPSFSIRSYVFSPANPVTNGLGNATVNAGATLRSSGTGTVYSDTNFTGTSTFFADY